MKIPGRCRLVMPLIVSYPGLTCRRGWRLIELIVRC